MGKQLLRRCNVEGRNVSVALVGLIHRAKLVQVFALDDFKVTVNCKALAVLKTEVPVGTTSLGGLGERS